ncbi:MAG: hypothetical protein V4505_12735 [Pseudomonadota bacterium]
MATNAELNQLYLAYFGRPADAGAYTYYANTPVAGVLAAFSQSAESQLLYGASFGAAQVNQVYLALFNRPAEAAGIAAWLALLAQGHITPAGLSLAILQGAQNADQAAVANKLVFTSQWTTTLEAQAETGGLSPASANLLAKALLAGVGSTPTSLSTTLAGVANAINSASASAPAVNLVLTTGATDVVVGTAGDDVINAITGTGTGATLNTGDTLDGKGGIDTLAIVNSTAASLTLSNSPVTNVEKLQVQTTGAAFTVDATGVAGLTDVVNNGSSQNLTFQGLVNVVNVAVQNVNNKATTVSFAGTALAGSTDALTLTLQNATGGAAVTLKAAVAAANELETLNIVSSGTANSITLGTDATQSSLATINISGAAALVLAFAGTTDPITTRATTVNAGTDTGGVTLGSFAVPLGVADQTITLGSGDDTVFFGANLSSADTVDGGAGKDTIGLSAAITDPTAMAHVRNVEAVRFDMASALVQDVAQLVPAAGTITSYSLNAVSTPVDYTLNKLNSGTTVNLLSAIGVLTETLAVANGTSDLNLNLFNPASTPMALAQMLDVAGLRTLNIVSGGITGAGQNSIADIQVTAKMVLTGSVDFSLTSLRANNGPLTLDASGFTGNLTFAGHTSTDTLILGSGNDTIIDGTGGANKITLGAQGLNAATGSDDIKVKFLGDTIGFVSNTATGNGGATAYAGTNISVATLSPKSANVWSSVKLTFSADDHDFSLNPTGTQAFTGLAKGSVAQGLTAGDAMVVQNITTNAGNTAATANVSVFNLGSQDFSGASLKTIFAAALAGTAVTGLAANGNYLVALYDSHTGASTEVLAVVNAGADGQLTAADFSDAGVAVIGTVDLSIAGSVFASTNFEAAF